jgi:hypothetical protein
MRETFRTLDAAVGGTILLLLFVGAAALLVWIH